MSLIELPIELQNFLSAAIVAGVTYVVVEGFKMLGEGLGKDFSAVAKVFAASLSAAVVAAVLGVLNVFLASVPPESEPLVAGILKVLVVLIGIFGAMGIHRIRKMRRYG